jgi:hypothetical protein
MTDLLYAALAGLTGAATWQALTWWRIRHDPTRARIPGRPLRITRYSTDDEGRVIRRLVVEVLSPEDAARVAAVADRLFDREDDR